MNTFQTIQQNHVQQVNEEKKIEKKIERLKKKLAKFSETNWIETLLRPVVNELKKEFPEWICDDERLTPMGLGCKVMVIFFKDPDADYETRYNEENCISITFQPGDLDEGELRYETGEQKNDYEPSTLGAINGFNAVKKPVESIEELVQFLKNQIK